MAYDASRDRVVLYGGRVQTTMSSVPTAQVWEFDGVDWSSASEAAEAAGTPSMTYDPHRGLVVAHGASVGYQSDFTYEYDGTTWSAIDEPLPSLAGAKLAFDGPRGQTVLHGGYKWGEAMAVDETWALGFQ